MSKLHFYRSYTTDTSMREPSIIGHVPTVFSKNAEHSAKLRAKKKRGRQAVALSRKVIASVAIPKRERSAMASLTASFRSCP